MQGSENIPEEKTKELLALAREIRETVGRQYSAGRDGDYAQVAVLGERLQQPFRQWEEMIRAAGDAGGSPPPEAGELIKEALELNQQTVDLLQQGLQDMQAAQEKLAAAHQAQRAYASALHPALPLINGRF